MFLSDRQQAVKQIKIVWGKERISSFTAGREFLRLGSSGSSQKFCIQLRNSGGSNKSREIPPSERWKINVIIKAGGRGVVGSLTGQMSSYDQVSVITGISYPHTSQLPTVSHLDALTQVSLNTSRYEEYNQNKPPAVFRNIN